MGLCKRDRYGDQTIVVTKCDSDPVLVRGVGVVHEREIAFINGEDPRGIIRYIKD